VHVDEPTELQHAWAAAGQLIDSAHGGTSFRWQRRKITKASRRNAFKGKLGALTRHLPSASQYVLDHANRRGMS
jgi:hypothetical protein